MILYRAPFSTNAERVALALAFKGLEVESVVISYDDRSEVERVSGQPLVPVLVDDDGLVVSDSMQIIAHLERRFADRPALYPADPARRAEVEVFVDWFNGVWKVAPNAIEAELGRATPDDQAIRGLAGSMAAALDRFEALLGGRDHLLGDAFGAADCCAFPFVKFALLRDPADDELFHRVLEEYQPLGDDHPRLADWIARVDERPRA